MTLTTPQSPLEPRTPRQGYYATAACLALWLLSIPAWASPPVIGPEEARSLGLRVWHNEGAGREEYLTWWNAGEDFASLGIGHFIWYPEGETGPFEESFPRLARYLAEGGIQLPEWLERALERGCPWPDRQAFLADRESPRMQSLRVLLIESIPQQSRYLVARLRDRFPAILAAVGEGQRQEIARRLSSLMANPHGRYALVDYLNFKGDGLNPNERYQGYGWGLMQALAEMSDDAPASDAFSDAAERVLRRRVAHAPPTRREERWLPGWRKRVASYREQDG